MNGRTSLSPTTRRLAVGPRGTAAVAVAATLTAGLLAGCGAGTGGPGEPAASASVAEGLGAVTTAPDGVQEVTLRTQDDYVFTPDRFTVAPGRVRVTLANVAEQMVHNMTFPAGEGPQDIVEEIPLLGPGEEETFEFTVEQPGEYLFVCSFHTQVGQVGTMTVRG